MKTLRLILLSTLPLWAFQGCSPKPVACDSTNCSGCCDATGQCQLGGSSDACGTAGQLCTTCFPGQLCSQGLCRAGATGGGMGNTGGGTGTGGGGGGGGMTGPLTCAAGKTACSGSCVDRSNDERNCGQCGTLCNSNQFCSNGACTILPTNCAMNRCPAGFFCDGSNECKPGCASNADCPAPGVCDTRLNVCSCAAGFHQCGQSCEADNNISACGPSCANCGGIDNAQPACSNNLCDFSCNPGFHRCGNECKRNDVAESCGSRCSPCQPPPNSVSICANEQCDFVCNSGFHRCGNQCLSNTDVNSCGSSSCSPCSAPANGTATCNGFSCDFTCNAGFHRCGSQCLSDTSTNSCGASCSPCSPPFNSTATCNGFSCGYSCNAGTHACSGQCVSNSSISTCGASSCTPCSPPLNAVATCNGVSCDFQCNFGYHRCGSSCVADTSVDSCGSTSCTPCAAGPANSTRTCSGGGTCGWTCNTGFHACNGQCVSDSSVTQCGASCSTCTAPANGSPICSTGACDFACNTGFHRCGNQCLSNTDVNSCGTSCTPCSNTVPANSTAACNGTSCSFTCNGGFFSCNGECVPADFVSACGASCTACTSSGTFDKPTCSSGSCGTACITSCNSACVDVNRDPANCGTCGTTCAGGETCTQGQCRASCGTGVGFGDVVPFLNVNPPSAQYRMLAEDLNGDGRVDLVDNAPTTGLRVLLGNADGTFQAPVLVVSSTFASRAIGFTLADLNGDGRKDLVAVRNATSANVFIALNNGSGGFNTPTITAMSSFAPSGAIAVADFNQDSRPDLMIAASATYNFIFLQGTTGWPTTYSNWTTTFLAGGTFADVGDFDKNTRADVLIASGSNYQVMLRGAGAWPAASTDASSAFLTSSPATAVGIAGVKVIDVNADTNVDGLVRTSGNLVYLQGTGTGQPVAQTALVLGGTGGLAVADLNGDGFLDLAGGTTGGITVALASAAGTWGTPSTKLVNAAGNVQTSVSAGQLAGSAAPELISANQGATVVQVSVMLNEGAGAFPGARVSGTTGAMSTGASGDVDGDGDLDLVLAPTVAANGTATANVVLGSNDGTFGGPLGAGLAIRGDELALGRLNGDAFADLVVSNESTTTPGIDVFMGAAGGNFAARTSVSTSSAPVRLQIIDLDGDLTADVVVGTATGVEWLKGNGDGSFAAARTLLTGLSTLSTFRVADLTLDGRLDLLVTTGTGTLAVYPGYGAGLFARTAATSVSVGSTATDIVVADLDIDGKPDVAVGTGAGVRLFKGASNGQLVAQTAQTTLVGRLLVVDMDNDGFLDLVSISANELAIARGAASFGYGAKQSWLPGRTLSGQLGFVDRFNGDSYRDVVVLAPSGSAAEIWGYLGTCR